MAGGGVGGARFSRCATSGVGSRKDGTGDGDRGEVTGGCWTNSNDGAAEDGDEEAGLERCESSLKGERERAVTRGVAGADDV